MMMSLSMVEAKLPPGFRFHPKDEELIDYLKKKVACCDGDQPPLIMIIEVDLNKCEPWDIPETACVGGKERYFYSKRDKKYATGLRTNRATLSGYWKATGKDKPVIKKGVLVGMRKTLVFYQGRAPKGKKTDWVMHEFRLEGPLALLNLSSLKEDWVLCRVFLKNRDIVAKHDHADHNYSYGGQTSTSSLPPLMDPYITSDRTQNHPNEHEQVPCFSIFAADQPFSYLTHMDQLPNFSTKIMPTFGSLPPDLGAYLNVNNTSSCHEQKVIKTVWNPNIIMGSPSFAEATTSDSFLSEVDLSTLWNNQC